MRVWVVDDDPAVLALLTIAITQAGHQVETFSGSRDLFRATATEPIRHPDVCLIDATLRRESGLDLVNVLADDERFGRLVLMSGDSGLRQALPAHVEWLDKPFSLARLGRLLTPDNKVPSPSAP